MRSNTFAVLAVSLAGLSLGCGTDSITTPGNGSQELLVKGRIASVVLGRSGVAPASRTFSSSTVEKVLVYRDFGEGVVE